MPTKIKDDKVNDKIYDTVKGYTPIKRVEDECMGGDISSKPDGGG